MQTSQCLTSLRTGRRQLTLQLCDEDSPGAWLHLSERVPALTGLRQHSRTSQRCSASSDSARLWALGWICGTDCEISSPSPTTPAPLLFLNSLSSYVLSRQYSGNLSAPTMLIFSFIWSLGGGQIPKYDTSIYAHGSK